MVKSNLLAKIALSIFTILILSLVGFIGVIYTALAGGGKFYTPLVMTVTIVLIIFGIIKIFDLVRPKLMKVLFLSMLGICVLTVGGYEINQAYHNSFTKVNEQGVDLERYQPFAEQTKAVSLEEESKLKIDSNLPRIDGATALYPLYAAFTQATYPNKEYSIKESEIMCNNTVGAYRNLLSGEADIIFAARPSKQQVEEAKRLGLELKLTPIGREAFVFFVNSKNEVKSLSTVQIQDIYSGKITNWREVGGKDEKIRAFQRPENSGSQTMLQKLMEGRTLMTPPKEDVALGMGDIINQTASYTNYKNAIGYSFLFFATEMVKNKEIKLLEVDGVSPDRNTIANGKYPLAAEFYAVTAGSKNQNIDQFIEWILSPQGQYLVEKTGYIPISK